MAVASHGMLVNHEWALQRLHWLIFAMWLNFMAVNMQQLTHSHPVAPADQRYERCDSTRYQSVRCKGLLPHLSAVEEDLHSRRIAVVIKSSFYLSIELYHLMVAADRLP